MTRENMFQSFIGLRPAERDKTVGCGLPRHANGRATRRNGAASRTLRGFLCAALLFLGAAAARAEIRANATLIGQDPSSPSPYIYVQIEVSHTGAFPLEYRVEIQGWGARESVTFDAKPLGPGETRVHHLPVFASDYRGRGIEVVGADASRVRLSISNDEKTFLNICELAGWASESRMQGFTADFWATPSSPGGPPGGSGKPNQVSQIAPPSLPDNWLCYTPFRAVFVSETVFNQMEPVQAQALLQWVESGGDLTIYHSAEPKTEKRLLGTIRREAASPLEARLIRNEWRRGNAGDWRRFYGAGEAATKDFPYAILKAGGKIGGIVLATLFFIVAGPLNHFYFSRRNRIRMLMISLPVLSIAFCLLITIYFLASQGFAKRGGSMSVTVLDERLDSAVTFSRHALLSGLYPLGGFQFDRQAGFYPLERRNRDESFTMDLTSGQTLTAGLFRPSITFQYFTAFPYKTREKLLLDRGAKTVSNGFETPIRKLILLDGDKVFQAGNLAPGEKGTLEAISGPRRSDPIELLQLLARDHFDASETGYLDRQMSEFLRGVAGRDGRSIYLISFEGTPPSAQPGTRIRSKRQCHVLAGLME